MADMEAKGADDLKCMFPTQTPIRSWLVDVVLHFHI